MTGPRVEECTAYLQGGRLAVLRLRRHITHRPGGEAPEEVPPRLVGQPLDRPGGTSRWTDPRGGAGSWTTGDAPHDTPMSYAITFLALLIGACLFLGLYTAGRALMCATHRTAAGHGALQNCPDYQPTTSTEPAR